MRVIETIADMKAFIKMNKEKGKSIGLVPTMGALHEGHLTLMRRARESCDVVVATIFVNPTQFGPGEDFQSYPRDLSGDSEKAASAGVDVLFHPLAAEMYPPGYATFINVRGITEKLCGISRPGHFQGVATIVTKLLNIIQPDRAFFGQKDAQQVLVIRRMVQDLNLDAAIEMVPIVRESDGLAQSSRNVYLCPEERNAALVLFRSLKKAEQAVSNGERSIGRLKDLVKKEIAAERLASIDYVEMYGYPDLQPLEELRGQVLLALAVRIGKTRLIDNMILEDSPACC
ncbi:Pantothenate synthetase [Propionispora sp. 2/2-37]|uniref:pantoate--beta-alanine ligase n=1 Tax=Propionispora sp. 2/2-37 TaxID=1677858 RepID=UPI0006BB7351|nr:pantoate--beta-alanine ligase [Propionispora sp. 2/2-37]CUH94630.1 Pantothenate synthetase [Propionispora sp. 2/2-37]